MKFSYEEVCFDPACGEDELLKVEFVASGVTATTAPAEVPGEVSWESEYWIG